MMNRHSRLSLTLVATAFLSAASSLHAQVVHTPEGRVEFVGLQRWSIDMIRDSMRVHAPGRSLGTCAGVLRDLGFPAAQALVLGMVDGFPSRLVVVVEPQDSARVKLRPVPRNDMPPVARWAVGYRLLRDHPRAFERAAGFFSVQLTRDTGLVRQVLASSPADSSAIRATWAFLDGQRSEREGTLARARLLGDSSLATRQIAAAVLVEHGADVRTWYALVEALTIADDRTAAAAEGALNALIQARPPRVGWTPAADALRAILDGTNVMGLATTMEALARTGVAPTLARRLLTGGGILPLDYLASGSPRHRAAAHAFLTQIAGRDLGDDPDAWRQWIATLE